jgi:hypothetical protein
MADNVGVNINLGSSELPTEHIASPVTSESVTGRLRYIEVGGWLSLQQEWSVIDHDGENWKQQFEWRDVPVILEKRT